MAEMAGQMSEDMKDTGRDLAQTGKQMLSDAKSKVSEAVSGVAAEAGERLDSTKNRIAEEGDRMADSLREIAGQNEDGGIQSRMLESVASGLTTMTDSLRQANPSAMMSSVQRFAQRNPLLFATGAAVAGLLVARALAGSSSSASQGRVHDRAYDRSGPEGATFGYDGDNEDVPFGVQS